MHLLQGHDVRLDAPDRLGDVPHMIAVDQLVVAGDVPGHHDERSALRLVAHLQPKARVDRTRTAIAGTDGIDGEDAVEEDQKGNGEHAEDQPSPHGGSMSCTARSTGNSPASAVADGTRMSRNKPRCRI